MRWESAAKPDVGGRYECVVAGFLNRQCWMTEPLIKDCKRDVLRTSQPQSNNLLLKDIRYRIIWLVSGTGSENGNEKLDAISPDYSLVSWSFPCRAVVEGLWLRFQGEQVEVCVRRERRRRILQTLVWFIVTLILALFIPDIGRVISLIGGLAACFIFVFPGNAFCIFFS